jgi:hypothetical protein
LPRTPTYRTYGELSDATGISVDWLRKNLRTRLATTAIRIIPGSPDGEVHLSDFKQWLKKVRIVKYTQMCMHLGMSKGQANGDIRRIRIRYLIPSTGTIFFIQERDAVALAQDHRETTRGLKGVIGTVRKPSTIKYNEDGKKKRTRVKPIETRPTLKPKPLVKPSSLTHEEKHPPDTSPDGLRRVGAEAHVAKKGLDYKPPTIFSDDRKPNEIVIRFDYPIPITITLKYG